MKIFISGPYSNPDPVINTRNAILAGDELAMRGHTVYIPHLNLQWHMVCPHDITFWYKHDLAWLEECNVILRLPGESYGADKEVAWAIKHGMRVIYDITDL